MSIDPDSPASFTNDSLEQSLALGMEAVDHADALTDSYSQGVTDDSCNSFCSSQCCSTNVNCYNTEGGCATVNANTCRCT